MDQTLSFIVIFLLGLCLGSFASLIAYRWPRGMAWVSVRSQCPSCGHVLGARDLVPVLSWVLAKGQCHYCQADVSARYPALEIIAAVLCVGLYALIGWQWLLVPALINVPVAMALILISFPRNS